MSHPIRELDGDSSWQEATGTEKRTLLDEFAPTVDDGDHLEVEVRGAPESSVALHEVELRNKRVENELVGRPTRTARPDRELSSSALRIERLFAIMAE